VPSNIEIKARVPDPAALEMRVREVADSGPHTFTQHDVFFACPNGRLKLRHFADGRAELIHYQRADTSGPKASTYQRVPVPDAEALASLLTAAYGGMGEVRKTRTLYLAGRTRIHLDDVAGLGAFVELEVVLAPDESPTDAHLEAQTLMNRLGILPEHLVEGAYVDALR